MTNPSQETLTLSPELTAQYPYLTFLRDGSRTDAHCAGIPDYSYDCLAISWFTIIGRGSVVTEIDPPPRFGCDTCDRRKHINFIAVK